MTFEHPLLAADSDLDALGHVNNVAFVRWIQDAAVAHSTAVGWDFAAYQRLGAFFVVRRHEVDYLRQVAAGDALVAKTWISQASGARCVRETELRRPADGEVVAHGRTTWVLIQIASGRPIRIQPDLVSAFGVGEGSPAPA
jgi:acyl-CoA thioester hydrolase